MCVLHTWAAEPQNAGYQTLFLSNTLFSIGFLFGVTPLTSGGSPPKYRFTNGGPDDWPPALLTSKSGFMEGICWRRLLRCLGHFVCLGGGVGV